MSALEARLRLTRGAFVLDVSLSVPARGVTALFGPSGSGKTTVLRCLAGLERAPDGEVRLESTVWQDARAGTFVPPHRRAVGYVFQEADLFPHLSVRGNLRFAWKRAPERRVSWEDAVAWLGVGPLLERSPSGLSGGERQRVAIARTLLSGPRLLLLDEPLSALDEVGRREILPYLEALPERLSLPIVYVSHSLHEVSRLADRLVWLVDGRVQAVGATAEVISHIDFAHWRGDEAVVVVDAVVHSHDDAYALTLLESPWGPVWTRRQARAPGSRVRVQLRASDVSLSLTPEAETSIMNQFALRILELRDAEPGEVLVRLGREGEASPLLARITRRSRDRLGLAVGMEVYARVKSVALLDG